jgi:hypothetical protein
MKEARSIRRRPLAARRLVLGTLAVVAFVAAAANVARWGGAPQVPATPPSQHGAAPEPPGAAPALPAIAQPDPAGAPPIAPAARPDAAPIARREPAAAPPVTESERATGRGLPPRVEAHARDAVDRYIADAGLEVGETEREALVDALGQVRASSRWLKQHGQARGDAEARRRRAMVDADRVFRDTLGVGVGEFVASLAPPGTIEDLGSARQ